MKSLVRALPALLALAACQPAPTDQAAAPAAAPKPAATSLPAADTLAAPPPAAPYLGYHRYRGTVGGQPVTVELTIDSIEVYPGKKLACTGSYYYGRGRAGLLTLAAASPYQPRQPLRLQETDGDQATGSWQATGPAGPVLAGTWRGAGGQALPFALREDYTDGHGNPVMVWYEVLREGDEMTWQPLREAGESKAAYRARAAVEEGTSSCDWDFLHLLGPDTLRPALRALQCPTPARRRRLMREKIAVPGSNRIEYMLEILYDGHGLLALGSSYMEDYTGMGAVHPLSDADAVTYDLRTGRPLTIAALIRPGTDTILSGLIARHLVKDENVTYDEALRPATDSPLAPPLPQNGLGVVPEGLKFQYGNAEVEVPEPPIAVVVPWRELLPLLRPNSPVARMLRERGLWRGK